MKNVLLGGFVIGTAGLSGQLYTRITQGDVSPWWWIGYLGLISISVLLLEWRVSRGSK